MKKLFILIIHMFIFSIYSYSDVLESELFPKGTEVQGFVKKVDAYFFIEDNWRLDVNPEAELNLTVSNITKGDKSSLTYYINGKPIISQKLIGDENGKLNIKVSIPKEYIIQGANKFTLEKIQMVTDLNCNLDEISSSNWVRIDKAFLSLNYVEDNNGMTLDNPPLPIANKYEFSKKKNINIMINENPTEGEKLTVANISAYIGKLNHNTSSPFNIISTKDIDKFNDNYLLISEFSRLPEKIKHLFTEDEKLALNTGLTFKIVNNPSNPEKRVIIITSSARVLNFGVNPLFDERLTKQIIGYFMTLQYEDSSFKKLEDSGDFNFSLKNLGFDDILVSGVGKNSGYAVIPIPKDKNFDKLVLNLNLKYSELVRGNNSTLKIILNGITIWDKTFENVNDTLKIDVPIPSEFYGDSKLVFEFQGNIVTKVTCEASPDPWILIENESYITGTYKNKENFSLMDFPAPFIKDAKFNNLAISVSDDFNSIKFMAELFRFMGQYIKYPSSLDYTNTHDLNKNVIMIGNPSDNKVLQDVRIEDRLFLDYNRDNTKFLSSIKFQFLGDNIYSAIEFASHDKSSHIAVFTDSNKYYGNVLNKFIANDFTTNTYLGINMSEGIEMGDKITPPEVKPITDLRNIEIIRAFIVILVIFAGLLLYLFKKSSDKNENKK